jgi:glycosyltransferase involved in cell wall biosynthesis
VSDATGISTSIVIPAYNESARLAAGYERLRDVLDAMDLERTEVVVVDDGSRDDTLRVAREVYGHLAHTQFVQQPVNRGKGAAVRLGISVATGDRVLTSDADLSIRPRHFPDFLEALEGCDVAPGSRIKEGSSAYESPLRTVAGKTFNLLVRHYTGTKMHDTQCGAKAFRLGPARVLGLLGFYDRFVFDAEMFFLAARLGLTVCPVDVTWDDVAGSTVRVGRDSLQMIRDLRSIPRTRYENPVVELARDVDVVEVATHARQARLIGLALARGESDSLLVLPRDGALGGASLADVLAGRLRTTRPEELHGRTFVAV